MKISRKQFEKNLEDRLVEITRDSNLREFFCQKLEEERSVPYQHAMDVVDFRVSLMELPESELYIFMDTCNNHAKELRIDKYPLSIAFTDTEIKSYESLQYEEKGIRFPINLPMIKVKENQWIGVITAKQLMKFRRAQMINYNENTQRTLQRIIRGETEYWKIRINETAVKQISELYESGSYLPNTITLNIPADDYEAEFIYNEEKQQLSIRKLDHFDILDGYHRFLALCRESDLNRRFDYPMELRITNFTEEQGKQFIFQEDQKTRMSKSDSTSMNQNRSANIVVDRLNANAIFYLKNSISRNDGIIKYSDLADMIEYYWFPSKINKKDERKALVELPKKLASWFNAVIDMDEKYATKKYTKNRLASVLAGAVATDFQFSRSVFDNIMEIEKELGKEKYLHSRRIAREALTLMKGGSDV